VATAIPAATLTPTVTATPDPTPTPQGITPDQDLAGIIAAAGDGDTIILGPGVFTLAQGIEISKNLTIAGAGSDQTTIEFSAPGEDFSAAIMYSGSGSLSIQGVKLSYAGADPSTVIYVKSGSLSLQDCYIHGATLSSSGSQLGALHLANDVVASVVDSRIAGTVERADPEAPQKVPGGILMYGTVRLTIEASEIYDSYLGIYAYGESQVTARDVTFRNTYVGVNLTESATASLENNTFADNTGFHLLMFGDTKATATGNTFTGTSASTGIQVHENGNIHLEGNNFSDMRSGIIFTDNATGEVISNTLTSLTSIAIFVQGQANPQLDSNAISGSYYPDGIGIVYQGNASGEAHHNQISNLVMGISLSELAAPSLESNEILYCEQGIFYQNEASGLATLNIIQFGDYGILIDSPAHPTITNNTIQAYLISLASSPEDWINQIEVADNSLQDGEPVIMIPTITPEP
jgi:nitrous oxidase accessory protein NosD